MRSLFILVTVLIAFNALAQKQKNIRVQVFHNQNLVVDTLINDANDPAQQTIESIVNKYSNENFKVNTSEQLDLYVFNISDQQWKGHQGTEMKFQAEENTSKAQQPTTKTPSTSNTESDRFDQMTEELDKEWDSNNPHGIDPVIDTLTSIANAIGRELNKIEINEESFDEFINDINVFFGKVKSSKVIVVEGSDTTVVKGSR